MVSLTFLTSPSVGVGGGAGMSTVTVSGLDETGLTPAAAIWPTLVIVWPCVTLLATVTTNETVPEAPGATALRAQLTVLVAASYVPPLSALTNVTPAGRTSDDTTEVAGPVPVFA